MRYCDGYEKTCHTSHPTNVNAHNTKIDFVGYIISDQGVEMRDEKVRNLKKFEPVNQLKDVQLFLGFANFYRRFIKEYSKIILPMT